jgi:hypothetical protein
MRLKWIRSGESPIVIISGNGDKRSGFMNIGKPLTTLNATSLSKKDNCMKSVQLRYDPS